MRQPKSSQKEMSFSSKKVRFQLDKSSVSFRLLSQVGSRLHFSLNLRKRT